MSQQTWLGFTCTEFEIVNNPRMIVVFSSVNPSLPATYTNSYVAM
jgi:hypothetical protein